MQAARAEELVRGFIAATLVFILIWLVVDTPNGADPAVVASVKTLAIAVIAFYFGLHKGTPHGEGPAEAGPRRGPKVKAPAGERRRQSEAN